MLPFSISENMESITEMLERCKRAATKASKLKNSMTEDRRELMTSRIDALTDAIAKITPMLVEEIRKLQQRRTAEYES
jgi:GTP1/Obg family GTP-binding protein